jgi:hypothetical protein
MMNNFSGSVLARPDVIEFLGLLAVRKVRYMIFGGCAVMLYSGRRYTSNIDIWIARNGGNVEALFGALKTFGAPLAGLSVEDFCQEGHFFQMGSPPVRIDDMLSTRGVTFDDAWEERQMMNFDGLLIPFISLNHLIRVKLASDRSQDIIDVRNLVRGIGPVM